MSDLCGTGLANNYCNNIKAKRSIFYIMGCEKIPSSAGQLVSLGGCNNLLGRTETFVSSGLHLDKDNASIGVGHNEVNFAGLAGEVACELFKAFAF